MRQPGNTASVEEKLQYLLDREEIRSVISAYGARIDMRDWTAFRELFTDRVDLDYSDMEYPIQSGVNVDEWISQCPEAFARFQATQHLNLARVIEIDGDDAYAVCMLHAQHYLPNDFGEPVQRMIGYYEKWLVRTEKGWKIRKVKSHLGWNEGNWRIQEIAAQRATAQISDR